MLNNTVKVRSFTLIPSTARNRDNALFSACAYAHLPELAEFIQYFQSAGDNLFVMPETNRYFITLLLDVHARLQLNNNYLATTLEAIISSLQEKNREKILMTLKKLQYEINNQFGKDLWAGFEIEDREGNLKRIHFNHVYNNFKRLNLFVSHLKTNYNISSQQINFIVCAFHHNGYQHYSLFDNHDVTEENQRLRLISNKNKQIVAINTSKHYIYAEKIIGIQSVYCELPETTRLTSKLPGIVRLPGLYEQENSHVQLNYEALEPQGHVVIPREQVTKYKNSSHFLTHLWNAIATKHIVAKKSFNASPVEIIKIGSEKRIESFSLTPPKIIKLPLL